MTDIICPRCLGRGGFDESDYGCCGNLTRGGECRGDCAVQVQVLRECPDCNGSGQLANPTLLSIANGRER